ncbi:hypothetical protein CC86DRAFT_405410 [Ophiobolus disseminans]|uniref:CorA-like transporter domain-containing protein n=1 Tax=Ophiobolus disseminans TaxID=1469910 RepID=A0A6A7A2E7_9PLEO|nr:hypothetical protein CC86DRAFT_405410 [Ophiobolus disseminans]
MSQEPDVFSGWQNYPRNLQISALDADTDQCNTRLKEDATRLFVPSEDECELRMQSFPRQIGPCRDLELTEVATSEALAERLKEFKQENSVWIFEIAQLYSWGQFLITEELFRKLVTALKVHSRFLDVVHTFGERAAPVEESYAAFFSKLYREPSPSLSCSYEITYNVKYVARHGRASQHDPFSIRQTGVYHKFQASSEPNIWLLLHPPENLSRRFAQACTHPQASEPVAQARYHALVFHCLSDNWREYVNYLEETFTTSMDRGCFSNLSEPSEVGEGMNDVSFGDIRQLQIMTDKLEKLKHLLELNSSTCERLQTLFDRIAFGSATGTDQSVREGDDNIKNCIFELDRHASRLKTLLKRAGGIKSMVIFHVHSFERTQLKYIIRSSTY